MADEGVSVQKGRSTVLRAGEDIAGVGVYMRYALAGAFCCAFTHGILTPVDV